jgi:hypothetical protein
MRDQPRRSKSSHPIRLTFMMLAGVFVGFLICPDLSAEASPPLIVIGAVGGLILELIARREAQLAARLRRE